MKVWVFRFTAKQLRLVHSDHLGFILASSHCCNELLSVYPYFIFEQNSDDLNEVEKAFIQIRFFTLVRLQIIRIFEYRALCDGYIGQIRRTYPEMAKRMSQKSSPISQRISEANWAYVIRNKIASHFDASFALEALQHLPDDEQLKFIVGRMHGMTAFDFADRILVGSMFRDAGKGDEAIGAGLIRRWCIDLQNLITNFHAEIMEDLFKQYGLLGKREELEIRDEFCPARGVVAIPLSTLEPVEWD